MSEDALSQLRQVEEEMLDLRARILACEIKETTLALWMHEIGTLAARLRGAIEAIEREAAFVSAARVALARWETYRANDCANNDYIAFAEAMIDLGALALEREA